MRRSRLTVVTVASLVAGLALMLPFESTITRALGIACLLAFIACGVFLIADPAMLAADEDEADGERS